MSILFSRDVAKRVWAYPLKFLSHALTAVQNLGGGGSPGYAPAPFVTNFEIKKFITLTSYKISDPLLIKSERNK